MKTGILTIAALLGACCAHAFGDGGGEASSLVLLKSGEEISGRILRVEKGRIRISVEIGAGWAETAVPLEQVARADFADGFDPEALPGEPRARLAALQWALERWGDFLAVPESNTGAMLLARATALAGLGRYDEALADLDRLRGDWDQARAVRAGPVRVRCLIGQKKYEQAMALAKQMEAAGGGDASAVAVRLALAEVSLGKEEYGSAAEQFLEVRLFHPQLREEAAAGLYGAARALSALGQWAAAEKLLADLETDYPGAPCVPQGRELRARARAETNNQPKKKEP